MTASQIIAGLALATIALDNGTAAIPVVDCLRSGVLFKQCNFLVALSNTDIALTVFKLQESDDNVTFTDVVGAVYGTAPAPALPTATDDNTMYIISVMSRKRYLKLVATAGDGAVGATLTVVYLLDEPVGATLAQQLLTARPSVGKEVILT